MSKTIWVIIIVSILAISGYFLLKGRYQAPSSVTPEITTPEKTPEVTAPEEVSEEVSRTAVPEVKEVTVVGTEYVFSPPTITVQARQPVKITFQNQGSLIHNLVIEELGIKTKTIRPGQTDVVEFTAPASGTYTIYCSVPGHRAAGMKGSLKVE